MKVVLGDQIAGFSDYLERLKSEQFYGKVELDFKSGKITGIREQKSIQPSFLLILEQQVV